MNATQKIALDLIKRSLQKDDTQPDETIAYEDADWDGAVAFMVNHAVIPLAWHAVKNMPSLHIPDEALAHLRSISIRLIAHSECMMEAQRQILDWFRLENIRCAVLKGSGVAACYPRPALRSLGDIDIWVECGRLREATEILTRNGYIAQKGDHTFHIGLERESTYVELHYAISEIPDNAGGQRVKAIMADAFDHLCNKTMNGYTFPILSPKHQALSLLLHMERHMMDGGIGLRQLTDWHVFVLSVDAQTFQANVVPALRESGLLRFAMVLTYACVLYLGVNSAHVPWCHDISRALADEMMMDILESGNFGSCSLERGTSALLLGPEMDDEAGSSIFQLSLSKINRNIQKKYPICKKIPALQVVFWIYLPVRYWLRSLIGKRNRQSTTRIVKTAAARQKLYQDLELFRMR